MAATWPACAWAPASERHPTTPNTSHSCTSGAGWKAGPWVPMPPSTHKTHAAQEVGGTPAPRLFVNFTMPHDGQQQDATPTIPTANRTPRPTEPRRCCAKCCFCARGGCTAPAHRESRRGGGGLVPPLPPSRTPPGFIIFSLPFDSNSFPLALSSLSRTPFYDLSRTPSLISTPTTLRFWNGEMTTTVPSLLVPALFCTALSRFPSPLFLSTCPVPWLHDCGAGWTPPVPGVACFVRYIVFRQGRIFE